jgi:hypothetical protein
MEYYKNTINNLVYGYDPLTQQDLINQAIADGWINITGNWPLPPTPEELTAQCKSTASELLSLTDWTSIADVGDPTKANPYLVNQAEFIAYRSIVRGYAVNPVVNPVFPTQPTEQWSS